MNLYLRYFDIETLVTNVDDAIDFLYSISEIEMNDQIAADVIDYFESENRFPKRYKVRQKVYFIMIKTEANSMQEFKAYRASAGTQDTNTSQPTGIATENTGCAKAFNPVLHALMFERYGWYEGAFDFKRVVTNPNTGKNEYRDTHFVAQCKAQSAFDCYNRIVSHLRSRVDSRSQFPSAKGKNFSYVFLGECKPIEIEEDE